jgi:LmbE family N-acetylglucosaminyl deacetylase
MMRGESRTAVVSAHPDDAVLSAWHALTRPDVRDVVTVFAGTPRAGSRPSPWDRLTRCADPVSRAAERRAEDEAALKTAGCVPVHLDFVGASHRIGVALDRTALRREIAAALGPAETVWLPAGIGGHPDHLAVRDAVLAAMPGTRRVLYADLPYAARFGWPSWVGTTDPALADDGLEGADGNALDIDGWFQAHLEGIDLTAARVHRLTEEQLAEKRLAIGHYRSQFPALAADSTPGFPDGPAWSYEITWEVR